MIEVFTKFRAIKPQIPQYFVNISRLYSSQIKRITQSNDNVDCVVCSYRKSGVLDVLINRNGKEGYDYVQMGPESPNLLHEEYGLHDHDAKVYFVIPKSDYLIRVVDLPIATDDEYLKMLELEIDSKLPFEYGDIQIAYHRIMDSPDGFNRFEVYAARKSRLTEYLDCMANYGLIPDAIIPSACVYRQMLLDNPTSQLLVIELAGDYRETAMYCDDGSLSVRSANANGRWERHFAECMRHVVSSNPATATSPIVGWFGQNCPDSSQDRIVFNDLNKSFESESMSDCLPLHGLGLMQYAVGHFSLTHQKNSLFNHNLLPQEVRVNREKRTLLSFLMLITLGFIATLLVLGIAVEIITYRYQGEVTRLESNMTTIRTEGETIGRRLQQLHLVEEAKDTSQDMFRVIKGLYTITPMGVTYNFVELNSDRTLRIRGQAESLALPFQLPEKLNQYSNFNNVLLQDASRSKRGRGSVVEFSIEAKLLKNDDAK